MRNQQLYVEQTIEEKLRRQAVLRRTEYTHPQIQLKHQPINAKQCMQLHKQLAALVKPRVDEIKRHYDLDDIKQNYQKSYTQFAEMVMHGQGQEKVSFEGIKQMHDIADILLHPPNFNDRDLQLYKKQAPTPLQQDELDSIFNQYQRAFKNKQKVQESQAEEAIRKAKVYLLKDYEGSLV